jgi:mRNA interferase MazF
MDPLKRGDVVTVAGSGDFAGKPRPGIVVQSDLFNSTHSSVTVVPITTTLVDAQLFRIEIRPTGDNGLRSRSQAMVDKIVSVRRDRIGSRVGALATPDMQRIDGALRLWLTL